MLFDTDILIWLFRGNEKAAQFLGRQPIRFTSQITWMELIQGAHDKRELAQVKQALQRYGLEILPINEAIGDIAVANMEEHSLKSGLMLSDALIGATAAKHNLPLATANVKHFRHLAGVTIHAFRP